MHAAVPYLRFLLLHRDMGGRQRPGGSTLEVSQHRQAVSRVGGASGTNRQLSAGVLVRLLLVSKGGTLTLLQQRLEAAGSLSQLLLCSPCRQSQSRPQTAGRPRVRCRALRCRAVLRRLSKRLLRTPPAAATNSKQPDSSRGSDGQIMRAAHLPLRSLQRHPASCKQEQWPQRLP